MIHAWRALKTLVLAQFVYAVCVAAGPSAYDCSQHLVRVNARDLLAQTELDDLLTSQEADLLPLMERDKAAFMRSLRGAISTLPAQEAPELVRLNEILD